MYMKQPNFTTIQNPLYQSNMSWITQIFLHSIRYHKLELLTILCIQPDTTNYSSMQNTRSLYLASIQLMFWRKKRELQNEIGGENIIQIHEMNTCGITSSVSSTINFQNWHCNYLYVRWPTLESYVPLTPNYAGTNQSFNLETCGLSLHLRSLIIYSLTHIHSKTRTTYIWLLIFVDIIPFFALAEMTGLDGSPTKEIGIPQLLLVTKILLDFGFQNKKRLLNLCPLPSMFYIRQKKIDRLVFSTTI